MMVSPSWIVLDDWLVDTPGNGLLVVFLLLKGPAAEAAAELRNQKSLGYTLAMRDRVVTR